MFLAEYADLEGEMRALCPVEERVWCGGQDGSIRVYSIQVHLSLSLSLVNCTVAVAVALAVAVAVTISVARTVLASDLISLSTFDHL
jgi:hypothetical protein